MRKYGSRVAAISVMLLAAVVVLGMPAGAAPARSATLNAANLKFTWHHGPVNSLGTDVAHPLAMCADPGFPCDDTLIQLTEAGGKLQLTTIADEDLPDGVRYRPDVDIYLYMSDANGTVGAEVNRSETPDASEAITVTKAAAGYYLLRVAYYSGIQVSYDGEAKFTPPPPPVPPLP
jgi:hypothetical protein